MNAITANELKIRGISAVEDQLENEDEVIISVRGKDRYVVMSLEKFASLREFELDMAVKEARADYEAGNTVTESVEDHIKRVTDAL
ncbi:type II toxin-antitoxin system prevent-host-death family antitoxin [Pseudomonadota bacterium]|jgi:prevent-host-death family protein